MSSLAGKNIDLTKISTTERALSNDELNQIVGMKVSILGGNGKIGPKGILFPARSSFIVDYDSGDFLPAKECKIRYEGKSTSTTIVNKALTSSVVNQYIVEGSIYQDRSKVYLGGQKGRNPIYEGNTDTVSDLLTETSITSKIGTKCSYSFRVDGKGSYWLAPKAPDRGRDTYNICLPGSYRGTTANGGNAELYQGGGSSHFERYSILCENFTQRPTDTTPDGVETVFNGGIPRVTGKSQTQVQIGNEVFTVPRSTKIWFFRRTSVTEPDVSTAMPVGWWTNDKYSANGISPNSTDNNSNTTGVIMDANPDDARVGVICRPGRTYFRMKFYQKLSFRSSTYSSTSSSWSSVSGSSPSGRIREILGKGDGVIYKYTCNQSSIDYSSKPSNVKVSPGSYGVRLEYTIDGYGLAPLYHSYAHMIDFDGSYKFGRSKDDSNTVYAGVFIECSIKGGPGVTPSGAYCSGRKFSILRTGKTTSLTSPNFTPSRGEYPSTSEYQNKYENGCSGVWGYDISVGNGGGKKTSTNADFGAWAKISKSDSYAYAVVFEFPYGYSAKWAPVFVEVVPGAGYSREYATGSEEPSADAYILGTYCDVGTPYSNYNPSTKQALITVSGQGFYVANARIVYDEKLGSGIGPYNTTTPRAMYVSATYMGNSDYRIMFINTGTTDIEVTETINGWPYSFTVKAGGDYAIDANYNAYIKFEFKDPILNTQEVYSPSEIYYLA